MLKLSELYVHTSNIEMFGPPGALLHAVVDQVGR